jgi:hypothetical protein
MKKKYKICFSITCHEEIEFLSKQIKSIQTLNENSLIIVHLSKNKQLNQYEKDIIDELTNNNNIFFNPNRVQTVYGKILTPIISNIDFSKQFEYEYICLLSSNEFIFRKGLYEYMINYDYANNHIKSDSTLIHQEKHQDCVRFSNFCGMSGQTYTGQHEGTFFKKELILKISDKILSFCSLDNLNKLGDTTEESILPTAVYFICNGYKRSRPITVLHERLNPLILGNNHFLDLDKTITFINTINKNNSLEGFVSYNCEETDLNFCFSLKRIPRNNSSNLLNYLIDQKSI